MAAFGVTGKNISMGLEKMMGGEMAHFLGEYVG